jgi:hypothetical protein
MKLMETHDPATRLYLYLTFNVPRTPYQAPKEYVDQYRQISDPSRRAYAGETNARTAPAPHSFGPSMTLPASCFPCSLTSNVP